MDNIVRWIKAFTHSLPLNEYPDLYEIKNNNYNYLIITEFISIDIGLLDQLQFN